MNDKNMRYFLIFLFFWIFQACQPDRIAPDLRTQMRTQISILQEIQTQNTQSLLDDINAQDKLLVGLQAGILSTAQKIYSLTFGYFQLLDSLEKTQQFIDYQAFKQITTDYQQAAQILLLAFNNTEHRGINPLTSAQMRKFLEEIFQTWNLAYPPKIPLALLKSQLLGINFRCMLFLENKVNRSSWFIKSMRLNTPNADTPSLSVGQVFRREILVSQYDAQKNTPCFIQNTPIPTYGFLPDYSRLGRDSVEIKAYFLNPKGQTDSLSQTLYYFVKP